MSLVLDKSKLFSIAIAKFVVYLRVNGSGPTISITCKDEIRDSKICLAG